MPKFIPYDHNQNAIVVINFQDQIQSGTFEYALHYLVEEKLDLSVFDPEYRNGVLGFFPPKTTLIAVGPASRAFPEGITLPHGLISLNMAHHLL